MMLTLRILNDDRPVDVALVRWRPFWMHGQRTIDMNELMASYQENLQYVQSEIQSALDKLKAGMREGPDGKVTLTNSEGMIFYRLLTEELGIKHHEMRTGERRR
jgi:hypothetical protein